MATDRARRSYDATRMYRSVVAQQGRVTVEADGNEAEEIRAAESRAELIDIIGPTGSPDDGFKISVSNPATDFEFAIARGTIYVGGVRVVAPETTTYTTQPEWADIQTKPDTEHRAIAPGSGITAIASRCVTDAPMSVTVPLAGSIVTRWVAPPPEPGARLSP